MGFLSSLFAHDGIPTPGPANDWWYQPIGGTMAASGQRVNDETARKISAWYRGRDLLATSLAMLPLPLLERLPNDAGSHVARGNPLYDVIHTQPNGWQDSFSWRRQKMYHLIDHGNAYDRIIEGPRGFVDQLWPLDPKLVTPEQVSATGRVVYHWRDPKTGRTTTYTQDEIFHLRGASDDGVVGKGVLQYARDSVGIALATESYAGRLFSQGALHGGVIENPGVLDPDAARRMAQSFVTSQSKWHMPKVLEQGSKYVESTLTPEDSQMLLSRKFSIDDIARWLGVPPHMIGSLDRSTNNNIEHQGQEFVTYSLGPWLSLWEFAINTQLVLFPNKYYAEFTRDALVRGDIAVRWTAHVAAVNAGIKSVDEVRRTENLNKRGGKADELREPANITGGKATAPEPEPMPKKKPAPMPPDDEEEGDDRARAIVTESSARVLRKEIYAALKAAAKYANDANGWATWVDGFYADHHELVMQTMLLDEPTAKSYVAIQRSELHSVGIAVTETWTPHYLAGLALDKPRHDPMPDLLKAAIERPSPAVHVPVTIQKGAVEVHPAAVHAHAAPTTVNQAPITIAEGAVRVETPVTIAKGAVQHETHIAAARATRTTVVNKKVNRDAKGQITSTTETHTEKDDQ